MAEYTFRVETVADHDRARILLGQMCINYVERQIISGELVKYEILVFTVDSWMDLETLRETMAVWIEEDPRFVDLHRCYQTLNEGDKPDDEWYNKLV